VIISARSLPPDTVLDCDICIVGAGAAGITLACELERSGLDVVMLEAGGPKYDADTQEGLSGAIAGESVHPPVDMYRRHVLGGATTIWGGRCVPLDPLDLQKRDFVPHSGWPIGWSELEAHYPRAIEYCEAGPYAFRVADALGDTAPATVQGFADRDLSATQLERFSPPTNFGEAYSGRLRQSPRVRTVLWAKALRLNEKDGALVSLDAESEPGRQLTVRARHYVLAMGGLETTRLLMASDATRRGGLGNAGDALGRFYMCHIENTLGRLRLQPATRPISLHFEQTADGVYVRRKFAITAEAQQRHRILNTAARLHYPLIADPSHRSGVLSMMYLVKDAIIPEYRRKLAAIELLNRDRMTRDGAFWAAHMRNVLLGAPAVASFGVDWLRRRTFARRKLPFVVVRGRDASYPLDVNAEQVPDRSNRVSLSNERDMSGRRRLLVDWRLTGQDVDSLVRSMHVMRASFARSGCGALEFDDADLAAQVRQSTPVGGHHLGTTRMSDSPAEGVVDRNCTVHGIANLHVASGSVFPTCGHANPTLTIVALAIRMAERLRTIALVPPSLPELVDAETV
jgi:choline dehydrogenase-like flavoprotein